MQCCSDLDLISPSCSWIWSIPRTQRSAERPLTQAKEGVSMARFHKELSALFWLPLATHSPSFRKESFQEKPSGAFASVGCIWCEIQATWVRLEGAGVEAGPWNIVLLPLLNAIWASWLWASLFLLWESKAMSLKVTQLLPVSNTLLWFTRSLRDWIKIWSWERT